VGETLDETMCGCRDCDCAGLVARGTHLVFLGPAGGAARRGRALQQQLNDPPVLAAAALPSPALRAAVAASPARVYSGVRAPLPANVQLVTLMRLEGDRALLRLGHAFQVCAAAALLRPCRSLAAPSLLPGCSPAAPSLPPAAPRLLPAAAACHLNPEAQPGGPGPDPACPGPARR
jgi:hypothetical protein